MSRVVKLYLIVLAAVLMIAAVSLSVGESYVSPADWFSALLGSTDNATQRTIIVQMRLPRVLGACLVGGALAGAGAALQGLFRNALAEPYIIGASSGAALGVAIAIVTGLQTSIGGLGATAAMAMIGSLAVVSLVLGLGVTVRGWSTTTLLLAGIAISSLINSIVSALMILNDMRAIAVLSWVMGSMGSAHWSSLLIAVVVVIPSLLIIFASSRALDAFSLGDSTALSLGLNLTWFRFVLVIAASLATAAAVSLAGIVGFVGLVAPHIARQAAGARHSTMLPLCILIGAGLMMLADSISRTMIAPAELPVGIITALIGSPFFLWMLVVGNRRSGGQPS